VAEGRGQRAALQQSCRKCETLEEFPIPPISPLPRLQRATRENGNRNVRRTNQRKQGIHRKKNVINIPTIFTIIKQNILLIYVCTKIRIYFNI